MGKEREKVIKKKAGEDRDMKKVIKENEIGRLFSVRDKVILVTGAGGLGETLAKAYAANGAVTLIASRTPGKAERTAAAVRAEGWNNCFAYDFDQTKKEECEALAAKIVEEFGRIDVLVNTAGIGKCYPPELFDEEDMKKIIEVNQSSAILISQAVGKVMIRQKAGRIIHIGSIAGIMTHTYESMVYEGTKAAVHQMVKSLAVAWAKYNINVNCIAPTWINTPMLSEEPESYFESANEMHPFRRMSEPEEYVGAAIFLASDASDYVSGHTLVVDGAWTSGRPLAYDKPEKGREAVGE